MDIPGQQPPVTTEQATPQPSMPPAPAPVPISSVKPSLEIPDAAAQALLAINNVGSSQKTKLRLPVGMIITIIVLILLVAVASTLVGKTSSSKGSTTTSPQTNTGSSSQSDTTENGGDKQINQDVNSCSNVVNAVSEC